ncbi:hypothetical protein JNUCC0626_49925 (plasmid) [Lentzea sp. JNUCC 0626]|uniref:hypothetical protein n=1 Tax=Lentzea sp. JNUCC 0626 TaxID=3367513 RepID=UPI0037489CCE
MIHTDSRPGLDVELAHRVDVLARLVWGAPRFVDALRWWAGFDLRREPRSPDERRLVDEHEALLLDVPPGTQVTARDGYLVAALGTEAFRVAAVSALVYEPAAGLDLARREQLDAGQIPLGRVLADAQRSTHYVTRLAGPPREDEPALRARATLLCGGRPAALVHETVLWRLLTHRAPGRLPHYAQARPGWEPMW